MFPDINCRKKNTYTAFYQITKIETLLLLLLLFQILFYIILYIAKWQHK